MENFIQPFPIFIYQDLIKKPIFNQIKKEVYDFSDNNKEKFKSNWGGCDTLSTLRVPRDKNIKSKLLEDQIKLHIENYYNLFHFEDYLNLSLNNIWINIAKTNDYQETHNHGRALFSGVLYINVDENSGDFQLINPLSTEVGIMPYTKMFDYSYTIIPKNGLIVLFPSWMNHRVLSNKSKIDRISVSFNIISI
jgi:uncharacterized protein (TIGR02466 family)|tara:strand:+ start:144 stop:722 length:579 start_codon:yes stop_codon:yes gene_type:complete